MQLQKVSGVIEAPPLGAQRTPVASECLAPNGRPDQATSDLASFWSNVYPEIRGQRRARYPKHRW